MIPKIIFIKYNNSMNIVINNNTTSIDSINQKLIDQISSLLSFTDKSKQYQLKRLSKSVWGKSSQKAAQLKTEIHQSLVVVKSDTSIEIPTRLLHLITPIVDISRAQDLRCDTGTKISLPWVNRPSTMRPYQEEAVDIITNNWCGLINFATGLGKTLTAVHAIRSLGRKTLIVCPNKSIAQQFHEILVSAFGSHRVGFFGDGKKSIKDLTVGIAQSVNNHLPEFKKHDLGFVLVDECFPYRENIATENGPMEIGRLVKNWEEGIPNPRVKSWNEDKKIFEYKNITYAWRKTNPNLVKVEYSKRVIKCTPNHKLLTNKGWKSAGDLVNGDLLLGSTGTKSERHQGYGLVEKVTPYKAKLKGGRQPFVFDIEVEDNHNFIVCSSNDSSGIIAHNCHHIAADTLFNITKGLGDVGRIFGLTATDFRNDGKDLLIAAGCGETLIRRDAKWGIENGWLAKPYFIVRHVATDGKDYPDDKLKNYKAHVLNCQIMKDQIQSDAQSFINAGKRVLIIVDEIAHGQELSNALGIPFATGEDKQSQTYINDFNNLKIVGLVATDGKVGEGVDTRPVEVLIIANFVASKGAVLQVIGRGLRKIPGKDKCLILDYIPSGSRMLQRHAMQRISYFKELTENVRII